MAPPLNRSWFDALIDDDGSGTTGTIWNKAQVDGLLDTIDTSLAGLVDTSGQIKFPVTQNASADATTFDDYREGNWTPFWTGTGGQSGQVYSVQQGDYIKSGRFCFGTGRLILSTQGTLSGDLGMGGLPFPAANLFCPGGLVFIGGQGFGSSGSFFSGLVNPNATTIAIRKIVAGGATGFSNVIATDATLNSDLFFLVGYFTAN